MKYIFLCVCLPFVLSSKTASKVVRSLIEEQQLQALELSKVSDNSVYLFDTSDTFVGASVKFHNNFVYQQSTTGHLGIILTPLQKNFKSFNSYNQFSNIILLKDNIGLKINHDSTTEESVKTIAVQTSTQ
uniref:Nonstructural protein WIV domain-containing protein n=1 Tax=Saiwaicho virus TaxID=2170594 RepID=A0A2S0S4P8_9VIRU|nr:hypothetical protein [Saiwaicho virus]